MYNENSFNNYIFWLKVRRAFLLILFSIIGCILGTILSEFFIEVLMLNESSKYLIITVSTLIFFSISLLLTINTSREIQDGYWKMAVLRKLTVISKKLDNLSPSDVEELNSATHSLSESLTTEKAHKKNSSKAIKKSSKNANLKTKKNTTSTETAYTNINSNNEDSTN